MSVTNIFRLRFETETGRVMSMDIPRANTMATVPEVNEAMRLIKTSGAVLTRNGRPVKNHSAELIETRTKELFMV